MTQKMVATLIGLSLVVCGFYGMFTHFFVYRDVQLAWTGGMIVLAAELLDHFTVSITPYLIRKLGTQLHPVSLVCFGWGVLGIVLFSLGAVIGGFVCSILSILTSVLRFR